MKHKILSFLTAFAMVFGIIAAPFVNASAAEATETESVTIHKILLTKEALDAHDKDKKYDGNEIQNIKDFFGDQKAKEINGVYFKLQKLNADVAEGDIDVNNDAQWTDIEGKSGLTKDDAGLKLDTKGLGKGTYRIVEDLKQSKYKGDNGELLAASKAVPTLLVLPVVNDAEGIVKDAHVYPKNTQEKPEIDKNFGKDNDLTTVEDKEGNQKAGADYNNYKANKATVTADIGKKIPYEVKTKIPKDSHYQKLVWNDNMTKGLTYNKDLVVSSDQLTGENALAAADYSIIATDRGFTLVFKQTGIDKIEKAAKAADVEIKLVYSATVNGDAVVDNPELNDIALDYSNKPGKDNEPKEFTPGKKEIKMKKSWDITGDQTITEADKNVVAYFTLQKKNDKGEWEDVKTVEKTEKDAFTVTFDNLDENGTYRIVESVKGYEAEYMEYNKETGEIEIKDHKNTDNPKELNPTEPKVQLGGRKFVKTNNEDKGSAKLERLAGAEFYVKNADNKYLVAAKKDAKAVTDAKAALDEAVKAYNGLSAEDQKGQKGTDAKTLINQKQEAYNEAFKNNATAYTWGEKTDPNVVVLTSDAEGRFEISGLEYKAGYELEEKTAPKGYAKLQSNEKFEVKEGSYASTDAELQYNKDNAEKGYGLQIKNKNVVIPQTGGIGSIIFVVAGLMIMGLAAYKMKANKEQA
ncbi:pilin N-terminal domain-containing protein [Anaerococcus hydrogenalis]|uniref:Cell wall anchor protein n=1 Tax=Anaerococcus hydrogenalis TaxID=33029 RepID=A0A2N6UHK0_9FIRM|nr:pilin N-terminal domain-containing protein [Anaerococcus hydrogenalis]MDK7695457.1 pilin N-terminal domain-containing protein [Anaerococcus hydrogenalis]MDK7697313.1 pilin N-terminal domain-containing protein [Anaerococcus hydrogenalis]MDK7708484.1 pilin N-terminal domain-containing protein [Anaerococcus hydrogenalis]PMC81082.1 cell wall anchor protein [Anaerococcus hydrogenalis]